MASAVIKRLVRRALGERRVQSLRTLIRDSSIFTQQAAVCEPGDGKVVVLSPHMDDETLGCGGTIARHAEAGAHVTVIFLTDGRHGGPSRAGMTGSERDGKQREIIEIRKEEAQCAGKSSRRTVDPVSGRGGRAAASRYARTQAAEGYSRTGAAGLCLFAVFPGKSHRSPGRQQRAVCRSGGDRARVRVPQLRGMDPPVPESRGQH